MLLALLVIALLCAMWLGVVLGTVRIPWQDATRYLWAFVSGGTIPADQATSYRIVADSRIPRVLSAAIVGAGLSAIGVAVQAMVRNALADPYVLGISSGASVGATSVALFGVLGTLGLYALPTAAFLGALGATALVYAIAYRDGGLSPLRLVLTGTALAYGFSAVTTVLVFLAPRGDAARTVMFWLFGSLSSATWRTTALVAVAVAVGLVILRGNARRLNALALGDEVAISMGVSASGFRTALFVLTAAMTGIIVSVCGAIGFVGLVVPHVARLLVGADHRRVLLVAPALGALFLVLADIAARTVVPPQELPLGAITAAVGVPLFIALMRRRTVGGA
ncbi:iron ABC transporter permease [Tsukamurella strandjordii]|uniref:Iron ABC transporter permease n=2 Tax=Tsukamurellaceae TaxID=85028 RepID=A0AA90SKN2_9ACTN|nr:MULTISPECIES: iron ABC transporter permease [Tsukamurella]MDP0397207.1 iron ABC transporter permease [Tsukamurella strandjordii]